jgi:hypothetical protein
MKLILGSYLSIKPFPGERVLIDSYKSVIKSSALRINGRWTDFYGIETVSTDTNRGNTSQRYPDVEAKSGIAVFGAHHLATLAKAASKHESFE